MMEISTKHKVKVIVPATVAVIPGRRDPGRIPPPESYYDIIASSDVSVTEAVIKIRDFAQTILRELEQNDPY